MDFDTFLNAGWNDHATDPESVWGRCREAVALVGEPGQLMALGILAAHVSGEHLGRWNEGAAFLNTLRGHASYSGGDPAARQLHVSCAALHLAAGDARASERELAHAASAHEHAASPRIRMLAATAAALAGRGHTGTAMAQFREALDLAAYDPPASDPAVRALAVTGNNLAVELEAASERDAAGTELMKTAAATARKYWERVGTWVNVRIAEVRLAHTHLQAHEPEAALAHARLALALCDDNGAPDADRFYPWIAQSLALHALGQHTGALEARDEAAHAFGTMDAGDLPYVKPDFEALEASLAGSTRP